jgi:hypothetical protein
MEAGDFTASGHYKPRCSGPEVFADIDQTMKVFLVFSHPFDFLKHPGAELVGPV